LSNGTNHRTAEDRKRSSEEKRENKSEQIPFKNLNGASDNSYYRKYPKNWTDTTLEAITKPNNLTNGNAISNKQATDRGGIRIIQPDAIGKMKLLGTDCKCVSKKAIEESGITEIESGYQ